MRAPILYIYEVLRRLPLPALRLLFGVAVFICTLLTLHVANRKGRLWAIALVACFIGILIVAAAVLIPRDVDYPEGGGTFAHQDTVHYLVSASMEAPSDLSNVKGGIFGSHLPIVSEKDFPQVAKKLRYDFHKAAAGSRLFHIIVIGGMNVRDIDEPLLEAARSLWNPAEPMWN